MSHVLATLRDEQAKLLDDALQAVKVQAFQMKRCVDNDRLLDGLKHCSTMLNELRTSSLTPKNYYELYLATFDALQYLIGALRAAHLSGRNHLADLYELVQYAGNIVPRLYLMITIGSAYMSLAGPISQDRTQGSDLDEVVPVREVMMDMLEMARGVQHPTRGLFLRYYLGQLTKDYLPLGTGDGPEGCLDDSTHFILTNFVEMNKLWVRLQHQGLSRDKERREAERRDLRTLVGSNLLRLASLTGVPRSTYENTVLPRLLSQVVSCRDTLAQEYLMEALVQAFSDEWHLATVGQLMEAISGLGPKVSIKTIVIPLVDRIASYAGRRREELEKSQTAGSHKPRDMEGSNSIGSSQVLSPKPEESEVISKANSIDKAIEDIEERVSKVSLEEDASNGAAENEIPVDQRVEDQEQEQPSEDQQQEQQVEISTNELEAMSTLFSSFWSHVSNLIEARPDLPVHDAVAICASMLRLSLACNPELLNPVDSVLVFVSGQLRARDLSPGAHAPATANQLLSLLLGPLRAYVNPLRVLELKNYAPLLESQNGRTRKSVAVALLTAILQRGTVMTTEDEVAGITRLCMSLISKHAKPEADALGGGTSAVTNSLRDTRPTSGLLTSEQGLVPTPLDEEDLAEEQGLLARLVHLIRAPSIASQLHLLTVVRDALSQGGDLVQYTYPAVVASATRLLGTYATMEPELESERATWSRQIHQVCRFIQSTVSVLIERSSGLPAAAELALQLFLMAAQAASMSPAFRDKPAIEEAAYEFIVQAFTIYEEHINESRAQYQALVLVINALHTSRNFSAENYETLAAKCVQHGSRLLKRPDQARIAYSCAQLWWKTLPDSELIPPPPELVEMHNNGDTVLSHLQRSLKLADSCLDPVLSVRLFVELLNQTTMHYERRCLAVTPKYINDLIDLIRTSVSNIEAFDASAPEPTRATADSGVADANALYEPEGPTNIYVLSYFNRTLDYIQSRKDLGESGGYNLPDFSAIRCVETADQEHADYF
ncbi:vacuolar protein sorting-associated protein 35 [Coemansia reversa NRRL 1564]|uniref:Vacuolar protein sorting-associated protein 35 n=1 Tax=Coemansia reversa (strain ATCC 12441 / NRRL 1564) TaxID=763665 RepID=A0A2G5BJ94_COERN|nr:vacuolar protein sorting-associated protein 35 [Coemansia reversa NRRL 1564]|eukprot:PIA19042.1 vacuolar protein sorting-associated protein 35 [Coemansia reversa NRRL 1564]